MLKRLWLPFVCLLVIGCAKKTPPGTWPAHVTDYKNFSEEQKAELTEALDYLNQKSSRTVIDLNSNGAGFPISFELVDPDATAPMRGGLTFLTEEGCTIQLSRKVYETAYASERIPVVIHEIGHCGGLVHNPTTREIMYKTASPLKDYAPDAFDRFFASLFSQAAL